MMQLITAEIYGEFVNDLADMHRLRYRVFKERLQWDVQVSGDLEIDEFDALHPAYLLQRAADGALQGCVRLLPSTRPTMLHDVFPALLGGNPAPASASLWESSRFALDLPPNARKPETGIASATFELFAGMIEFGLSRQLTNIVTVTDARMERILRRAGWPLRRIADPASIGNTLAVAGYLEVSTAALMRVRTGGGIGNPVLWAPVIGAAA